MIRFIRQQSRLMKVKLAGKEVHAYCAPEICKWCGGKGGFAHTQGWTVCSVCGGVGSVLVVQPARRCAWCEGRGGYPQLEHWVKCEACGGMGWAHAGCLPRGFLKKQVEK